MTRRFSQLLREILDKIVDVIGTVDFACWNAVTQVCYGAREQCSAKSYDGEHGRSKIFASPSKPPTRGGKAISLV